MRFEIHKTRPLVRKPQFYYVLKSGNNEIMMVSESMKQKQSCHRAIKSIRDAFKDDTVRIVDKTV